jgi:hypothetical protein
MKKVSAFVCLVIMMFLGAGAGVARAQPGVFDIKIWPSKLELSGPPGSTQQFDINVENFGADQLLRVYFNDYYIMAANDFVFRPPGHYSYSCAKWLSTDSPQLAAPAGATVSKRFTVAIPPKAEPGGHYAVIFLEQVPPAGGPPVKAKPRIGALVMLTVPGQIVRSGGIKSVSVSSGWFWPTKKIPLLGVKTVKCRVVFQNTGNVHLTIRGSIAYTPEFGWGTGRLNLGEITVLPHTTRYLEGTINNPPFLGSYKVRATVKYGPSLDVYDTAKTGQGSYNCYPFSLLLVLGIVLGVIITPLVVVSKKKKKEQAGEEPSEGKAAKEENERKKAKAEPAEEDEEAAELEMEEVEKPEPAVEEKAEEEPAEEHEGETPERVKEKAEKPDKEEEEGAAATPGWWRRNRIEKLEKLQREEEERTMEKDGGEADD